MRYRLALVLAVWLFSNLVLMLLASFSLQPERYADSWRQRLSPPRQPDPHIVLVGLDDEVFEREAFNRPNHAKLLKNLRTAGARLVFFDVVFDEDRAPELDHPLLEATQDWPTIIFAASSTSTDDGQILPPRLAPFLEPAVESGQLELGTIEKAEDDDGVLRWYFLGLGIGESTYPSAALAAYSVLQLVRPSGVNYQADLIDVPPAQIPVRQHRVLDTAEQPITTYAFDLKYHPPATGPNHQPGPGTYRVVPYMRILEADPTSLAMMRDAIVVVGENTTSADDLVNTPIGAVKGFEVHAQCLDRLLHHDFYTQATSSTNRAAGVILISLVALLGLITWPLSVLISLGTLIPTLYLLFNQWLYQQKHLQLDLALPLLGCAVALSCHVLVRLALASRFLGRFIPKEAARGLLMARATSEATEATVIVTDIRGYTSLSETRTPVEMLKLLNEYHSVTVDIYHKHGGNVLTFQGDAQLVVFGYPRRLKDAAGSAVKACVEVMTAIDELRAKWGIRERKNFDVGAGLTTGLVYVGDIGSRDQANYTVIGEVVRTSHKVQSMSDTLEGNVLLDESSYEACLSKPHVTAIPNVMLEGFPEPKTLYRVESSTQPASPEDQHEDRQAIEREETQGKQQT